MNIVIRSSLILTLLTLFGFADSAQGNMEQPFELLGKHGQKTLYILQLNEFALTQQKKEVSGIETVKKIKDNPAYTLFSVKRNNIGTSSAKDIKKESLKKGNVYYKYGRKDDDHRYISTGQIIVVFNRDHLSDLQVFAKEHDLTYLKTLDTAKKQTVLFANHSKYNEIELSSILMQLPWVETAKPNWILPFKLF